MITVHRIKLAKKTGLPFERPKHFDLQAYDDMGHFGYGKVEKIELKLWINDYLKLLLEETPFSKDQSIVRMPDDSTGWDLSATVLKSMQLGWWLRSQGKSSRVLALTCPQSPYQSKFQKSGGSRLTDPCIGFTVLH